MSESSVPAGMDMETVLTRAVKKFFKWQLSGVTGTLIVASMLWFVVFFFFFLILVFVMCVEYHYDKRERRDAELALPSDEKMWAEKRPTSRETSKTSLKKVVPISLPPLPNDQPKAVLVSDIPEAPQSPEPAARQESPNTEAVTEESVIVDAGSEEAAPNSPSPPQDEVPAAEEAEGNTQGEEADANECGDCNKEESAAPESETQPEEGETADDKAADDAAAPEGEENAEPPNEEENANADVTSPSKVSTHSKKGED